MGWTDPSLHVFGSSELVTSATMNTFIQQNLSFMGSTPSVGVYNSLGLSVPNNTPTALTWNSEHWKRDAGMHSTITNTTRLTCTVAGIYRFHGGVEWTANATGARGLQIMINGALVVKAVNQAPLASGTTQQEISLTYAMSIGDYMELMAVQTTGSTSSVNANGYSPQFSMTFDGF